MVFIVLVPSVLNGKERLVGEIKEKTNAVIIKELATDGAMIQYNSMGEVKGKYHANHIETADVKLKMDGTNEWEVRAMETTKEGDVVTVVVPKHKEIAVGTLRGILFQAGITVEEFVNLAEKS